jgi:hypothetical protein
MRLSKLASAGMLLSCCLIPTFAVASTEPISGLPLFPGAKLVDTQPQATVCGIAVRGVQYESNQPGTKAVDFYRKAIPGAGAWTTVAFAEFLASNGKASVRVLPTPDGGMYLVYGSFSKPVTMARLRAGLKC